MTRKMVMLQPVVLVLSGIFMSPRAPSTMKIEDATVLSLREAAGDEAISAREDKDCFATLAMAALPFSRGNHGNSV